MENHLTSSEAELEHAEVMAFTRAADLLGLASHAGQAVVPHAYQDPKGGIHYAPEALKAANVDSFTRLDRLLRLDAIQQRYDHIPLETVSSEIIGFWELPMGIGREPEDELLETVESRCKHHPVNVRNGSARIVASDDLDQIEAELSSIRHQLRERTISKKAAAKSLRAVSEAVERLNTRS